MVTSAPTIAAPLLSNTVPRTEVLAVAWPKACAQTSNIRVNPTKAAEGNQQRLFACLMVFVSNKRFIERFEKFEGPVRGKPCGVLIAGKLPQLSLTIQRAYALTNRRKYVN